MPSCGNWWSGECKRGHRRPARHRVSGAPGPVAPLQLRTSDAGGGEAVLVAHVS
jgi:hypothetical protein